MLQIQEARSALHLAAESGNADICEMLLAKNAYVNSRTKAGWTPLHYVAFNGFNELIQPLVAKHNAAIDATSMVGIFMEIVQTHLQNMICYQCSAKLGYIKKFDYPMNHCMKVISVYTNNEY